MKPSVITPAYVALYPLLSEVARKHGYCLAIHGSVGRDMDLLAAPWTETAGDPLDMIKEMKAVTASVTHSSEDDQFFPDCNPTSKPHGRLAYSLHLTDRGGAGPYLDVSVMPRLTSRTPISGG